MAQDATGTPSVNWGIPKFNTAADAPSGKGNNAIVDFIDDIIIPDLIFNAKGDLIAASAADTATRLAVGTNGHVLTADSAEATGIKWAAPAASFSVGYGTALPGSPADGDLFILVDSTSAPTYSWMLRYVSAKSSNKWVFVGGAPGHNAVQDTGTAETTTSTTYAALATAGPSFAIPVAGDYDVRIGFTGAVTSGSDAAMSYDIGGTGAVDADRILADSDGVGSQSVFRIKRKTGLTAVTLTAKYRILSAGTASYASRFMSVVPVAIGG